MGLEVVYALIALGAAGVFVLLVRRASERQLRDPGARREQLGAVDDDGAAPAAPPADTAREPEITGAEAGGAAAAGPAPGESDDGAAEVRRLRDGLAKTRGGFVAKLGHLFSRKKIDGAILQELEEVLFTADIGPRTAKRLFQAVQAAMSRQELSDPEAIWERIRDESATILSVGSPDIDFSRHRPFVILTVGVNGVGKTTTIGKLAARLRREGRTVLVAAGDTFRAAAVEQLQIWGERAGATVVTGKPGADPASVVFDAIKHAIAAPYDMVLADTAGRLHTRSELMEELKKVRRVCDKALAGAPHETWLVLDATTGQNAIQQAQMFKEAMDITGIVLAKLDGTAKGGVILGVCDQMQIPVRYIGIGETIEDLRPFDPHTFVEALYQHTAEAA